MARLQLHFPENQFCFSTQLTVRVTDINAGNHLGNDSMISMLSEARALPVQYGVEEVDGTGLGIIVTDLSTIPRRSPCTRRADLRSGRDGLQPYGGDIIFRITRPATTLVAMAKYGFVFFNYKTSKVTPMPPEFLAKFPHVNRLE
jgi:acyl-CoA thioesterase FadM